MLKVGDKAPLFSLQDSTGQTINLADYLSKKNVVLYFYPKDDTPGCTVEAQEFSQSKADYDKLETVILGVSKDTVRSHAKFCQRYGLTITLLSDPDGSVIESYDAWQEKSMFGKTFMGIVRSTFLIDKTGTIRQIWPKVTPEAHASDVLKAIAAI